MKARLYQLLTWTLVLALLADPRLAAYAVSLPAPAAAPSAFTESALVAALLANKRFPLLPFRSYSRSLKESTPRASLLLYRERVQAREINWLVGIATALISARQHLLIHQPMWQFALVFGLQVVVARWIATWVSERLHERGHLRAAQRGLNQDKAIVIESQGDLLVVHRSDHEPIIDAEIPRAGREMSQRVVVLSLTLLLGLLLLQPFLFSGSFMQPHHWFNETWSVMVTFLTGMTAASLRFTFADQSLRAAPETISSTQRADIETIAEAIQRIPYEERQRLHKEGLDYMEDRYYTYLENGFDKEIIKLLGLPEEIIYITFALALRDNQNHHTKLDSPYLRQLEVFKNWHRNQKVTIEVSDPKSEGDYHFISLDMHPSQAGNLEAITRLIVDRKADIGLRSKKNGTLADLYISKRTSEGHLLDIDELVGAIRKLSIERGKPRVIKDFRRVGLHIPLSNTHGSFNALLQTLKLHNIRTESFLFDQLPGEATEWCDFTLKVPSSLSDKDLSQLLRTLRHKKDRLLTPGLTIEIYNANISENTARATLQFIEQKLRSLGEAIPDPHLPHTLRDDSAGSLDDHFLVDFQKALDIAMDYHGNVDPDHKRARIAAEQHRESHRQPYIVHPLAVAHTAILYYGIRNPLTIFALLNHDVFEDGSKNVMTWLEREWNTLETNLPLNYVLDGMKAAHPQLSNALDALAMSYVQQPKDLATAERLQRAFAAHRPALRTAVEAEVRSRFQKDFATYPHKIIQAIESVTTKTGYIKTLSDKAFIEYVSMKLCDRAVNLYDIHEVPDKVEVIEDGPEIGKTIEKKNFARRQISKTLNELLPLITKETPRMRGYIAGRQHFMHIFMKQALRLQEEDWNEIYETLKSTRQLPKELFKFNQWIDENPSIFTDDVASVDDLKIFQGRLDTLARRIQGHQLSQRRGVPSESSLLLFKEDNANELITNIWFLGTPFENLLEFKIEVTSEDVLRGQLYHKGSSVPLADLTFRDYGDGKRIQGPMLIIRDAGKAFLKPYKEPLFVIFLSWLKISGRTIVEFPLSQEDHLEPLIAMLDKLRRDPAVVPYESISEIDGPELDFLTVHLNNLQLGVSTQRHSMPLWIPLTGAIPWIHMHPWLSTGIMLLAVWAIPKLYAQIYTSPRVTQWRRATLRSA